MLDPIDVVAQPRAHVDARVIRREMKPLEGQILRDVGWVVVQSPSLARQLLGHRWMGRSDMRFTL